MRNYVMIFVFLLIFFLDCAFGSEQTNKSNLLLSVELKYIVYLLAIASVAVVGGISQSKIARVAFKGIGKSPERSNKIFVPMVLAMALVESLIIITFATILIVK